jgi:hypothetical protein
MAIDTTSPGLSSAVLSTSATATSIIVSWTKASDVVSPQSKLTYKVYSSTQNNLTTLSTIDTLGKFEGSGTDISTYTIDGLLPSTTYYINVLVHDEAGNKTLYTTKSQTTAAAQQLLPVPGANQNTWGTVLNTFLLVSHNNDGTLKPVPIAQTIFGTQNTTNIDIKGTLRVQQPITLASQYTTTLSTAIATATTSINWDKGGRQKITLANSITTLYLINPTPGGMYELIITQDGTGGRTIAWPSNVKWNGGIAPALSTAANTSTVLSFLFDGVNYFGNASSVVQTPTLSIRDFGAIPNNGLEQTDAIQDAIDAAIKGPIKTVVFPPGLYNVKKINITAGLTLLGYGATLKLLPYQPDGVRIFTTHIGGYQYMGNVDSKPLIIKGFTLDGNRLNQNIGEIDYKKFNLEHQCGIMTQAEIADPNQPAPTATNPITDPTSPILMKGRLVTHIEDVRAQNFCGDGISVSFNSNTTIRNCIVENNFRAGIVIGGANCIVNIDGLTSIGYEERNGIHMEQNTDKYFIGNNVTIKNSNIYNQFSAPVQYGGTLNVDNVIVGSDYHFQATKGSIATISNSKFGTNGKPNPGTNRNVAFPGNITFTNVDFYAPNLTTDPGDINPHAAVTVRMRSSATDPYINQTLKFINSRFHGPIAGFPTWDIYGIRVDGDSLSSNNKIIVQNSNFDPKFTAKYYRAHTTHITEL